MTESHVSVNGEDAAHVALHLPRVGLWTATVRMASVKNIAGRVKLAIGSTTWLGTVRSVGSLGGATELLIVGAAGMLRDCSPRFYTRCSLSLPVAELVSEAGEKMEARSSVTGSLSSWVRPRVTAAAALSALVPTWRAESDGSIWAGTETWTPVSPKPEAVQLTGADHPAHRLEAAMVEPTLRPGMSWQGFKITHVDLDVSPDACRGSVYYADN